MGQFGSKISGQPDVDRLVVERNTKKRIVLKTKFQNQRKSIPNRKSFLDGPVESKMSGTGQTDLDRFIVERKMNRRRTLNEKLQKQLKAIRDRKVPGVNHEPFPEGAFEQLESNGIWHLVLEYLTDPSDVTSAYFACGTFAEILEKRRTLMMLPKVLNVFKSMVDEAYEVKGRKVGNASYKNWNKICLNSRGVSKAWKKAVDIHSNIARIDWAQSRHWMDPRTKVFFFDDVNSINHSLSSFEGRGLAVSPIRDVQVEMVVTDRMSGTFYGKLMEYLKAFGGSLRYFSFDYGSPDNIAPGVYGRLCEMLKCMENLKILEISFNEYFEGESDDEEIEGQHDFQNVQHHHQQERLHQYSLPTLDSLEHFRCSDWETKEYLVSEFLRKCVNLKSVDFMRTVPAEEETMDALMRLPLEKFCGPLAVITSTSNQFSWPLKHLKINVGYTESIKASVLFPAINRFQDTLEELHIWNTSKPIRMDREDVSLELPHLKLIRIGKMSVTFGFDHLLLLQSLEKIIVWDFQDENRNSKVKVKKHIRRRSMDKSNVWQWFPNLKRLRLRRDFAFSRGRNLDGKLFQRPVQN